MFYFILRPFMPVFVVGEGDALLLGSSLITVTDVCSGVLLLILVAIFLTIRSSSLLKILSVVGLLFTVNVVRVFTVSYALLEFGLEEASLLHDGYYFGYTALALGIIAWAVLSSFRKSSEERVKQR